MHCLARGYADAVACFTFWMLAPSIFNVKWFQTKAAVS